MALKVIEGFDLDHLPGLMTGGLVGGNPNTIATSYGAGRTAGSRCLRHGSAFNGNTLNTRYFEIPSHGAGAQGFAFKNENASIPTTTEFFQVCEGSTPHLGLRRNAALHIEVVRGGTVLGTTAETVDFNVWTHFDLEYVIHNTAGSFILRLNGEIVLVLNGVDTRNGGTSGVVDRTQWSSNGTASAQYVNIDDWYVCDSSGAAPYNRSLGDCKVETLRPTAPGAESDWIGSDGNSVDNWQLIDDNSTTTDYIGSTVVGDRDLSALADPATDLGPVLAVQVEAYAAKSDAGAAPGSLLAALRSSGGTVTTDQIATAAQLATGYQWFTGPIKTVDPAGDDWTEVRLTGLQAGVEVGS